MSAILQLLRVIRAEDGKECIVMPMVPDFEDEDENVILHCSRKKYPDFCAFCVVFPLVKKMKSQYFCISN